MCFSVEADVAVGLALLPVAALSLREVRCAREAPFALLPLVFAAHQLIEAVAWAGAEGRVGEGPAHAATIAYLVIALPLLPTLMPLSVVLLEPAERRGRVTPFLFLGVIVSAYLGWAVATHEVTVRALPHALDYDVGLQYGGLWATLYIVAVIGPPLMSGYRSIIAFGVANLVGLTVVGLLYRDAFVSLWCVYAAVVSVLVWLHMLRRRRIPEPLRLTGDRPLKVGH